MLYNNQYYLESVCNTCLLIWESTGFLLTNIRSLENFYLVEVKLVSSISDFYGKSLVLVLLFLLLLTLTSY